MMVWALVFLALAVVSGILSFVLVTGAAAAIAKLVFGLLLMLCIAVFIAGLYLGGRTRS